jgi:hypothetical protein
MCTAVHRADQTRTIIYPRLARALMDRKHVAATREVLLKYAERAQAKRATEVLTQLEGQDEETIGPAVEKVLEAVSKGEETRARRRDEEAKSDFVVVHDTASDMPPEPPPMRDLEPPPLEFATHDEPPARIEPVAPPPPPPPPPPPRVSAPAPRQSRPSMRQPRRSQPVTRPEPARSPMPLLIGGVLAGIVIGSVLTQVGILPSFLGGGAPEEVAAAPVEAPMMDSMAVLDTPFVARDTAQVLVAPPVAPALVVEDPIAVEGLMIAEVLPHQEDGQRGYRVLQPLGGGDTLTLFVIPQTGAVTTLLPIVTPSGAGATGVVAYAGMRVRAAAPIAPDSLAVLLMRLGGGGQ